MWLYSCVHTDRVHCSLLNFRCFPLVGSIFVYPFPSGCLECIFSVVLGHHCCTLHGMTYILQVIVLGLASHKHRYTQATASGKSSIMNLHLVHIHTYMAKVHMNMHAGLCVCTVVLHVLLPRFYHTSTHFVYSPFCPPPSGWLDCSSACSSLWPQGGSARAV